MNPLEALETEIRILERWIKIYRLTIPFIRKPRLNTEPWYTDACLHIANLREAYDQLQLFLKEQK